MIKHEYKCARNSCGTHTHTHTHTHTQNFISFYRVIQLCNDACCLYKDSAFTSFSHTHPICSYAHYNNSTIRNNTHTLMKSHRHYRSAQCISQLSLNERTRVSKSVSNDVMFLNQSSQPPEQTADWNQQPWTQDLRSSSVPGLVALRTCLRGSRWKLRSVRGDRPRCKSWRISAAPEHPGGSPATRRD